MLPETLIDAYSPQQEAARQAAASRAAASASAQQGYDLQRAQLASQNERFAQEMGLNALGGLADMYRAAPGQVGMYNDDYLGGLAGWNDSIGTGVGTQVPMPKGQNNWMGALNTGLNMIPGLFGGGGNKTNASSYAGYTDDLGRPYDSSYSSYFGSPSYPSGGSSGGSGTVTTDEDYRFYPDNPNYYPDQPWLGGGSIMNSSGARGQLVY